MEETEISPNKKIPVDPKLAEWLQEFKSFNTRKVYRAGLRKFKQALNINDLDKYLKSNPDVTTDTRTFLKFLDGKPSRTVTTYTAAVKVFLQDYGMEIPNGEWKKIRRRGYMPKRAKTETRDKKPTIQQLKKILNYADLKARAMILFLLSSGARIGETLQICKDDLNLNADPPKAFIKAEYTKGGVGERTVYFSYEARDAIKDWLNIKDGLKKRGLGTDYKGEKVFQWAKTTARFMWNSACDKAGYETRDSRTGRRVYHIHSLRKFFRTKIGLDLDITHALMGHSEYLDNAYLRLEEKGEIAEAYKEAMPNVSVYAVNEINEDLAKRLKKLEKENTTLKAQLNGAKPEMLEMHRELEAVKGMLQESAKQTIAQKILWLREKGAPKTIIQIGERMLQDDKVSVEDVKRFYDYGFGVIVAFEKETKQRL